MKYKYTFLILPALILMTSFTAKVNAFTPLATNPDGSLYKRQVPASGQLSFSWNLETGPMQDDTAIHNFTSMSDFNSYCASRSGSGGGGGSCSMNPLLKDLMAQDVSNAEGSTLVTTAFSSWMTEATQANTVVTQGASLGTTVDICNVDQYADELTLVTSANDPRVCGCLGTCTDHACYNPIIFDANGDITANLAGDRIGILGTTGPIQVPGYNYFPNAISILNGACLEPNPLSQCNGFSLSNADFQAVVTHEMGHFFGLGHTLVNPTAVINFSTLASGASPDAVPTMYPGLVVQEQAALAQDDEAGLAYLYPKSTLSSGFCTATGHVYNANNAAPFRCAEVVLRDTTSGNPTVNATAFVSGMQAPNDEDPDNRGANNCTNPNADSCGQYTIPGLIPGHTYQVSVNPIPNFGSGSTIGPCITNQTFPTINNNGSIACSSAGQALTGGALEVTVHP